MNIRDQITERLRYDPHTGYFWWTCAGKGRRVDKPAGTSFITPSGKTYIRIKVDGHQWFAHRLAWFYVFNVIPTMIDHISGDGTDNRILNLRVVTPSENSQNQKRFKNNKSGVTGVHWHTRANKWQARIHFNNRTRSLGLFNTIAEAKHARDEALSDNGFHPNHGSDRPL